MFNVQAARNLSGYFDWRYIPRICTSKWRTRILSESKKLQMHCILSVFRVALQEWKYRTILLREIRTSLFVIRWKLYSFLGTMCLEIILHYTDKRKNTIYSYEQAWTSSSFCDFFFPFPFQNSQIDSILVSILFFFWLSFLFCCQS